MFIFVSYNKKDRRLVDGLVGELAGFGHTVWFDQSIPAGHAWWNVILENIRKCDLFVFALTPQALESGPCKLEYTYAKSVNKCILPVLLADVSTPALPPILSEIQYIDYRQQQDKETYKALSKALTTLPPPVPLPDPLPLAPEPPISELGKLGDQVDAKSLTIQEQAALVLELKDFLKQKETTKDARGLLLRLQNRQDLFAKVKQEIDEVLASSGAARPVSQASPVPLATDDDIFAAHINYASPANVSPQPVSYQASFQPAPYPQNPAATSSKAAMNTTALVVGFIAAFFGLFGIAHLITGKNSDGIKFFVGGLVYDVGFYLALSFVQSMFGYSYLNCYNFGLCGDSSGIPSFILLAVHLGIVWVVSKRGATINAAG